MPAERHRLVKLVRDGVEKFLDGNPTIEYRPIPVRSMFIAELRKKLLEEGAEYLLNPSVGELADCLEAVRGLAEHDLGVGMAAVEAEADAKRAERGGFDEGIGMWATTVAPARHEGEHATTFCEECGIRGGIHRDDCSHRHDLQRFPGAKYPDEQASSPTRGSLGEVLRPGPS